jgi:pyruvate/2-oxoglutarate dehydrogenase complex dihydrolipoamide dehydrogenase (E3) component
VPESRQHIHYDAIVIGAGQAGPGMATTLAGRGRHVAVVERHRFGGTCVNTGCIPTKALVASARAAHMARRAADFGIRVTGPVAVDLPAVLRRKDGIVRPSREGVEKMLRTTDGITVYRDHGRFVGPRRVQVGDGPIVLEAEHVFVDVGARALIPSIPGLDSVEVLDNARMMDLDELPEHLVIIGGSALGLEFAQIYRRFGSRVTVVERADRLFAQDDPDISGVLKEIFEAEGIDVKLDTVCTAVSREGMGVQVCLERKTSSTHQNIHASHLLLAAGRRPNTDDLGAEAADLRLDERGYIVVDDQLRTSAEGVWALGDCHGRGAFTHTSYNDFEIVAANLLDGDHRRLTDRVPCYALYVDPPLGRAGMTEAEARESGRRILCGRRPMSTVGRAKEKDETRGFMKLLVDADSEQIVGASIFGVGGDEVVHVLLDAMHAKVRYPVLRRAMHIHPTVAELVPTVLGSLESLE